MKEFTAMLLVVFVIILGATWIAQGNSFFLYKAFAPKVEQVRYDTFKQSQAYNDGITKDVADYQLRYLSATADQRPAIASIILQEVATYDTSKLPPAQQVFINQLRVQQGFTQ